MKIPEVRYMLIRAVGDEDMPEEMPPEGEKPAPPAKGRTRVIASTANPDRYDDVVDQSTWKIDRFMRNPVVPWGHDYQIPPVGKVVALSVESGALTAEIEWDKSEENALGRLVAAQFEGGFLSAVSVGFRPGRSIARSQMPKDSPWYKEAGYGQVFYDCELLEISAVVVPANADALAAKGLPAMKLTAPEVKEEIVRLLTADADVRRLLDDRILDVVENSGEMKRARAEEASSRVLRDLFNLPRA